MKFFTKMVQSLSSRSIKNFEKRAILTEKLYEEYKDYDDETILSKANEIREKAKSLSQKDYSKNLEEVFALVKVAADRELGLNAYRVQLIGANAIYENMVAEMKTGEGKTLTVLFPMAMHALYGEGVHIITVNDYLSKRDSDQAFRVLKRLGITVGHIYPNMPEEDRKNAYLCDVTYGTSAEFGFDFLRDGLKTDISQRVQRELNLAIIDEIDSVLLDEATTPLIISSIPDSDVSFIIQMNSIVDVIGIEHVTIERKEMNLWLKEENFDILEEFLISKNLMVEGSLHSLENSHTLHRVNQTLKAHYLFEKDRDYIIRDGEILIVDPNTGRSLTGRRWSDGLHQAIEAKEGVNVMPESRTSASITIQNLFRSYRMLAGMTGTASSDREELEETYGLEVLEVPTHRPLIRVDESDKIWMRKSFRDQAMLERVKEEHAKGRPILLGAGSVGRAEEVSELLKENNITHNLLSARYHAQEAEIIAMAGRINAITVATSMAGRGTDILLGGDLKSKLKDIEDPIEIAKIKAEHEIEYQKVRELGGLLVLGTERAESRRVDDQLRGRSGRQGDPGGSCFYVSMEDPLLMVFGGDKTANLMSRMGMKDTDNIDSSLVTKSLAKAQKKAEARNYESRKQLLKFDDVGFSQSQAYKGKRDEMLLEDKLEEELLKNYLDILVKEREAYITEEMYPEQWKTVDLEKALEKHFSLKIDITAKSQEEGVDANALDEFIKVEALKKLDLAKERLGPDTAETIKGLWAQAVENGWMDHMEDLTYLRQGIGLRSYAQKDPVQEWRREAFQLFQGFWNRINYVWIKNFLSWSDAPANWRDLYNPNKSSESVIPENPIEDSEQITLQFQFKDIVLGQPRRNALCPCGSGKRFKNCHGVNPIIEMRYSNAA